MEVSNHFAHQVCEKTVLFFLALRCKSLLCSKYSCLHACTLHWPYRVRINAQTNLFSPKLTNSSYFLKLLWLQVQLFLIVCWNKSNPCCYFTGFVVYQSVQKYERSLRGWGPLTNRHHVLLLYIALNVRTGCSNALINRTAFIKGLYKFNDPFIDN